MSMNVNRKLETLNIDIHIHRVQEMAHSYINKMLIAVSLSGYSYEYGLINLKRGKLGEL